MQLDTVRELKSSWYSRVLPSEVVDASAHGGVPAAGPVALGAAPVSGGYALAVRYRYDGPLVARLVEQLREQVGDAEVDVRAIGTVQALPGPYDRLRGRLRPLEAGSSICHEADTAGTLGALVRRGDELLALSNSHVLARAGLASPGDVVLQPGPADGGLVADRVGVLDSAVPLSAHRPNLVDAALARLDPGVEVDLRGSTGPTAVLDGEELVEKLGRTTGYTRGRVSAIEVDDVVVDFGEVGMIRFDGQVEVSCVGDAPFSAGGDSGSLVRLADGGPAVGLLFAGSERGGPDGTGLTFCNDITAVLDALGVELPEPR